VVVLLVFYVIVDWNASTGPISGNLLTLTLLALALIRPKNCVVVSLGLNVPTNGFAFCMAISLMLVDTANNVLYENVLSYSVLLILLHNPLMMKMVVLAVIVASVPVAMNVLALVISHKHVAEVYHNVLMDIFVMSPLTMLEASVDQINAFVH
jgi:hypothetical protein